ncbi:MAG: T9SS type A sorting domain-containing protein, partial [Bacteroidia bacterium]
EECFIDYTGINSGVLTISLNSLTGQRILSVQTNLTAQSGRAVLNLQTLPAGVYLVCLETQDGIKQVVKLIHE